MRPHYELLEPPGGPARRWFTMLHGFLGAGRNWRTVARRVVEAMEDWGGLLVDLRLHGRSTGFPPPHTIQAAADDLEALAAHIGHRPSAVLGHSFGGKVALQYLRQATVPPDQVWVFDSTPDVGDPGGGVRETLGLLREVSGPFASRQEAIAALTRRGLEERTAVWLATNLEQRSDGVAWRPDLDALDELLRSFFTTDLWPVVDDPPQASEIHFVKADRSGLLTESASERILRAGETTGRVFLHVLSGGHWLNADNPDGLVELMTESLG